ncbi:MAG: molecular chaperone HtpG, partial [Pseudomonadota bacterium]|nr:molecular chaperone HtpG [Pseudomonadota bacterium]
MTVDTRKETLGFQAEIKELLRLMIHSLYSHSEIFLRELISNASDACDKLKFEALTDAALYEKDSDLNVTVIWDAKAKTLSVRDNGIGMSREEVVENIGTIARSGTRRFIEAMTGEASKDMNLIGQFGVGFYSSFIVADRVTLFTRRAGRPSDEGVKWESTGEGEYTLEQIERQERGTEIILHLRSEHAEYCDGFRLKALIRKYSDHIGLPVRLIEAGQTEFETVNQAGALWAKPKQELSEEQYHDFYKRIAHDSNAPLIYAHNHVEGRQNYTSLLFIPSRAPFDLWDRDHHRGLKLYVRRVFIMDDADSLLPHYLRFVRGIIDAQDLPLNVSREILQTNSDIDAIRSACVKRILGMIEEL